MARFAVPSVRAWVRDRRDAVVRELEAAAAVRGEAQRLKSEWEQRLGKLESEIGAMRAQAQQDIERERERILAAARASADAMLRDAQRLAAAEAKQLEAQLRADVARKAVALAEERVRAQWSNDDQQRLISDFLKQVQP
jgi:F-type H+-transporting ATPase subunit b